MTKLADLSPSTRNKGNTSPIKTKTHIYKRKNRSRKRNIAITYS